jgi:hypothetical protein
MIVPVVVTHEPHSGMGMVFNRWFISSKRLVHLLIGAIKPAYPAVN